MTLKTRPFVGQRLKVAMRRCFAEIKRRIPTSRHEGKRQKSTQEQGNNKSQAMDKKSQSEESEGQSERQGTALRRSNRKRTTTKRLQLNAVPGKRCTEKEVEIIPEDSESESDQSFVTVGENSCGEMSSEGDESDPSSSEKKLGRRKKGGTIPAHVWSW